MLLQLVQENVFEVNFFKPRLFAATTSSRTLSCALGGISATPDSTPLQAHSQRSNAHHIKGFGGGSCCSYPLRRSQRLSATAEVTRHLRTGLCSLPVRTGRGLTACLLLFDSSHIAKVTDCSRLLWTENNLLQSRLYVLPRLPSAMLCSQSVFKRGLLLLPVWYATGAL